MGAGVHELTLVSFLSNNKAEVTLSSLHKADIYGKLQLVRYVQGEANDVVRGTNLILTMCNIFEEDKVLFIFISFRTNTYY